MQITQKAGVDGRLFGSVTNVDIVEALAGLGHTVEKAMVRMPDGPLKHIGEFPLTIALHADARGAHQRPRPGRHDRGSGRLTGTRAAAHDPGPETAPFRSAPRVKSRLIIQRA